MFLLETILLKILFLPMLLTIFNSSPAQIARPSPILGTGAYSILFADVFSGSANQASLAKTRRFSAGLYTERKYLLRELSEHRLAMTIPLQWGGIGIDIGHAGFSDYSETSTGIGYGKELGPVDIGIGFRYRHLRIGGYGTAYALGLELGTIWHLSESVHAGIHISNPAGGKWIGMFRQQQPSRYTAGIGYEVSRQVLISTVISKEEDRPVEWHAGVDYNLTNRFFFKAGINTWSATPYLGGGWGWPHWRILVSGSYHQVLGVTPGCAVIFQPGKEQQP